MPVTALVLAAGRGLRLGGRVAKPLVLINSKPILMYSLETFQKHRDIDNIIVVVSEALRDEVDALIKRYRIRKVTRIVPGGLRRQDSVLNGLRALQQKNGMVLIHDSARPFIDSRTISAVIKEALVCGAAIAAVAVKSTIKEVFVSSGKALIRKTLDRGRLWEAQTPQVFKQELLMKACKKFALSQVTDDAMFVEKLGVRVRLVPGSYSNIKVTTPEDIIVAQALARNRRKIRGI
ncbi:MAG: 2-C-methyl-D-erythritol 4-phosphate cytidylyltransferase [Candidatus Omnitrophota bacterium]